MKCDCCGKRRHVFESYEKIENGLLKINLCVQCSKHLYQMRDLLKESKTDEYEAKKQSIEKNMKKSSPEFIEWYDCFIKGINEGNSEAI